MADDFEVMAEVEVGLNDFVREDAESWISHCVSDALSKVGASQKDNFVCAVVHQTPCPSEGFGGFIGCRCDVVKVLVVKVTDRLQGKLSSIDAIRPARLGKTIAEGEGN